MEGRGGPLGPELAYLGQAQPHGSHGAKRCPIPLVARLTLAIAPPPRPRGALGQASPASQFPSSSSSSSLPIRSDAVPFCIPGGWSEGGLGTARPWG